MNDSLISGFYRLDIRQRIERLEQRGLLSADDASALRQGRHVLVPAAADKIIENVIGVFGLPFAISPNFIVNGAGRLAPMVVEEPSIVAGLSFAAALASRNGGFQASCDESLLAGQIHVTNIADAESAAASVEAAADELLAAANAVHPRLGERGGGVRDVEVRRLLLPGGDAALAVHLLVDTRDAMGANLVNTICEAIAPRVAGICGGTVAMRILSNLADRSLATARVSYLPEQLAVDDLDGAAVRDAIVMTSDIAAADPYRAATHNKGIMNGIDAVAIATGNDWRAIEAGAHAYAGIDGQYRPLSRWSVGSRESGGRPGATDSRRRIGCGTGAADGGGRARAELRGPARAGYQRHTERPHAPARSQPGGCERHCRRPVRRGRRATRRERRDQ